MFGNLKAMLGKSSAATSVTAEAGAASDTIPTEPTTAVVDGDFFDGGAAMEAVLSYLYEVMKPVDPPPSAKRLLKTMQEQVSLQTVLLAVSFGVVFFK